MYLYQRYKTNAYPIADYTPDNFFQKRPYDVAEGAVDTWSFGSLTIKQEEPFGHFILSGSQFYRSAIDNEDGTEALALVFLPASVYLPAPIPTNENFTYWTGEARFESTFKGPVQFVAGIFGTTQSSLYQETWVVPGLDAAHGGAFGTDLAFWTQIPAAFRERAAFIHVTYQATKQLELSAGVRQSKLEHDNDYIANGVINGGYANVPLTSKESHTSPRFGARYVLSANHMVYATAANGYRVGGPNTPLPPICDPYLQQYGIPIPVPPYKSDTLWSYEIGTKDAWSDNRVQSRFAVFRINWSDIQQGVEFPCQFGYTANAGYAVSKGAELELDTRPLEHLILSLKGGYTDARITEASKITRTVVGQTLQGVPMWTGSAIAQYTVPMGPRSAFFRGDWSYTGFRRSYIVELPPTGLPMNSYSIVNLRMGVDQDPWEVALFVRNLFNKLGTIGDLFEETSQVPGRPRLFVTRPRTYGLQIQRNF
jgi:outer membrane receptor protein involved in Fe transport